MIAVTIGRTFLKAYNAKYEKNYSAKEFFDKEYFECFFNHPKYMQWITNSPFVQMKAGQKVELLSSDERKEKLNALHVKIEKGEQDASIAIGFSASEVSEFATTSGLITDMNIGTNKEDVYLSWIGGGLGIGVSGGYAIFFNNSEVLLHLYDGWKVYRNFLADKSLNLLRGNQINTWNGQWLNFRYSKFYAEDFDFNTFQNENVFNLDDKQIEINTVKWNKLFFSLSNAFCNSFFTGYVYSLGQTNKTLGFYPFYFKKAHSLKSFYQRLFGEQAAIEQAKEYEDLFGIHIKRACELGSLGLQALEPQDLRKYYGNEKTLKLVKPIFTQKKDESEDAFSHRKYNGIQKDTENIIYYRTYKTWLLAMITKNKEETLEYTKEVAEALHVYRNRGTKTDRINLIQNDLLATKSKKNFIDALVSIMDGVKKDDVDVAELDIYKELRDRVHMMNAEDFGYFVVLLKFDFAYADRK